MVGDELYRLDVGSGGAVRAGVVVAHGLGEHIERYRGLGERLEAMGCAVEGVDLPGHGRSPGIRGHLGGWGVVEDVFDDMVARVRERVGEGQPLGLVGHSMGAFLGLRYMELRPDVFSFAWLSSPLLRPRAMKPASIRFGARVLAAVCPHCRLDTGVRPNLCRIVPEGEEPDPYFHSWVTSVWGVELWNLEKEIFEALESLNPQLRLLITQGGADTICPAGYARALYELAKVRDKKWLLYRDEMHEPLFGARSEEVLRDVMVWLEERID
ncbi:MAG: alpha/beta fold hydrolase [Verrucomicrobiota bacterium]